MAYLLDRVCDFNMLVIANGLNLLSKVKTLPLSFSKHLDKNFGVVNIDP